MKIYQVDSFTREAFQGNPAGVCILKEEAQPEWMQNIASEMNLSETAFLVPDNGQYKLRWFTPEVEVDLCGHATLASAHILFETGKANLHDAIRFQTRSGLLTVKKNGELIEMLFPATPAKPVSAPQGLLEALGFEKVLFCGKNDYDYLIIVQTEQGVKSCTPDFLRLKKITERGVIVSAEAESIPHDFISRFFGPAAGIDEDPVTGSAHCTLAPYWGKKLEKETMLAYQASKRGGEVRVTLMENNVILSGYAVTVMTSTLSESGMPY